MTNGLTRMLPTNRLTQSKTPRDGSHTSKDEGGELIVMQACGSEFGSPVTRKSQRVGKPRARQTPKAHWPARQAERLNFRFSKKLCPKNYSREEQRKTTSTEALPTHTSKGG